MTEYKGYQTRILSKIILNKIGKNQKMSNKFNLVSTEFNIEYVKEQKKINDFYEILAILEQFSKQKPVLKFEKIMEVGEKVKLKNMKIKVNLNKKEGETFFWYFVMILLSDRRKRNLIESNYIDLNQSNLRFEYTTLKMLRKVLLSEVQNINNFLMIQFKFTKAKTKLDKYKNYMNIKYLLNK